MARIEFKQVQGLRQNGTSWHGIDVMLDKERLDRAFIKDRELRHIAANPSALRIGIIQRSGRDGSTYEIAQLMLGSLAVGTRLKLNDVEKTDVKTALAEQSAQDMGEDKKNR
ncbi:MAG: hypothetical protein ABF747_06270 [Bifidobacterium sp.]|uniref:Uncharacterized protein n=1 Tax=Bifidobacterium fermentum TaxID=3059035 RepID=A0AB39ULP7_9BIFI